MFCSEEFRKCRKARDHRVIMIMVSENDTCSLCTKALGNVLSASFTDQHAPGTLYILEASNVLHVPRYDKRCRRHQSFPCASLDFGIDCDVILADFWTAIVGAQHVIFAMPS